MGLVDICMPGLIARRKQAELHSAQEYIRETMTESLALVSRAFPHAIIGGGIVLDFQLGRRAFNDVDVFVPYRGDVRSAELLLTKHGILSHESWRNVQQYVPADYISTFTGTFEERRERLPANFTHGKVGKLPTIRLNSRVELIFLPVETVDDATSIIRSTPLPLCWGTFNGAMIDIPWDMQSDLNDRCITVRQDLVPADTASILDTQRRVERLQQKTGWPLR